MERHITFTSATGETTSCSVYDIADTLTDWYPDAPAEVTDAIAVLARRVVVSRSLSEPAKPASQRSWARFGIRPRPVQCFACRRYGTLTSAQQLDT